MHPKQILLPCLLALTVFFSCNPEPGQDPAPQPAPVVINMYIGNIAAIDSVTIELEQGLQMHHQRFTLEGDTAQAVISNLEPGSWNTLITVYSALPEALGSRPGAKHVYRAPLSLSAGSSRAVYYINQPVGNTSSPHITQVLWQSYFFYQSPNLYWLVPVDPCVPNFEAKSRLYTYFYCDKAFTDVNGRVVASQKVEYPYPKANTILRVENAFAPVANECKQKTWKNASTMLIAMNELSGKETIFFHQW